MLTLEDYCSKLGERHERPEIMRLLGETVKTCESSQMECQTALQKTQPQLKEVVQKATHSSHLSGDLENKDIIEAVSRVVDHSGKLKLLEHALHDAKMVETCTVKEKQDYKQKLKNLKIQCNSYQDTTGIFHGSSRNILKIYMEPPKTLNSLSILEKEQAWGYHATDIKLYFKAIRIKTTWCWHKNRYRD